MDMLKIFKSKWMVLVGVVFLLPLLGGCQDEGVPDEIRTINDAYAAIVGEWEWERTERMYRGGLEIETPESEGLTRRIIFTRNKVARIIVNREMTRETEYRIEFYASAFLLRFIDTGNSMNLLIGSDTLLLSNPAFGHSLMYIKK